MRLPRNMLHVAKAQQPKTPRHIDLARKNFTTVPPELTSELLHCLSTLPEPWPKIQYGQFQPVGIKNGKTFLQTHMWGMQLKTTSHKPGAFAVSRSIDASDTSSGCLQPPSLWASAWTCHRPKEAMTEKKGPAVERSCMKKPKCLCASARKKFSSRFNFSNCFIKDNALTSWQHWSCVKTTQLLYDSYMYETHWWDGYVLAGAFFIFFPSIRSINTLLHVAD